MEAKKKVALLSEKAHGLVELHCCEEASLGQVWDALVEFQAYVADRIMASKQPENKEEAKGEADAKEGPEA